MKDLEKLLKLPLLKNKFDLQLFAEDSDNGDDGEDPDNEPNTSLKDGEGENPSDKKYSDEDVDKLISKKFAEWEKKRQKEEAKFKEAQKLKNMTEQDADTTKANVENFAKIFKAAVQKEVAAKLRHEPPKKGSKTKMTKEEIFKVENTAERQKLISENMELFQ